MSHLTFIIVEALLHCNTLQRNRKSPLLCPSLIRTTPPLVSMDKDTTDESFHYRPPLRVLSFAEHE